MDEDRYNDLLVELECPICTHYMVPPIRQCSTGHSICEPCRRRLPKCPLCQGKFTESRNITLEGLACKMHYPCINKDSGCMVQLTYENRVAHELHCSYKGFKCAMERCPWVGNLEDIAKHWDSKKMTSKSYVANNICHSKLKPESYYVNIIKAHNQLFWFKCKATGGNLLWAVQFIGPAQQAANYYYEIEICKPGMAKKKVLFSEYCQSVDLDNYQLLQDGACVCTTLKSINQYVGEDQLLIYYMRVLEVNKNVQGKMEAGASNFVKKDNKQKYRDRSQGPVGHNQNNKYPFNKNPNYKKQNKPGKCGDFELL